MDNFLYFSEILNRICLLKLTEVIILCCKTKLHMKILIMISSSFIKTEGITVKNNSRKIGQTLLPSWISMKT